MRISDWSSDVCSSDLVDLYPTVHRTGVHDDGVGLGLFEALGGEAVERMIFARRGQVGAVHALVLEAEHHHDVGVLQPFAHVRSEEHTSELQSLMRISYAVFCLKKNKN